MAVMPHSFDLVEAASEKMTLKFRITRQREFFARMWLVTVMLRVIGWIAPMPIDVEMVHHDEA